MNLLALSQKKTTILMYAFVYYLIIGSDCVLFCYNRNEALPKYSQYFMVLLSLIFMGSVMVKKRFAMRKKDGLLFITVLSLLFAAVIHSEFSGGYISLIALFILGNYFFDLVDQKEFVKAFLNIMTLICIVSLMTFFFASFFCRISLLPSIYNNMDREYKFYFFSNVSMINPERNYGLFTEPSRFQAYLNLGLIFLMFAEEKKLDLKRIVLFIVTLLTTFSTTGFIAFAIVFIAFVFSGKVHMKRLYNTNLKL